MSKRSLKKHDFVLGHFRVAIVGCPNVGKSTIFNRLIGKGDAIVSDVAGTTRDRKEGSAHVGDLNFTLVDTGGYEDMSSGRLTDTQLLAPAHGASLVDSMKMQIRHGVRTCEAIVFVVDAKKGITTDDIELSRWIRKNFPVKTPEKPNPPRLILLANKSERQGDAFEWGGTDNHWSNFLADCYKLGFGEPVPFSAVHNHGVGDLHNALLPCGIEAGIQMLAEGSDPESLVKLAKEFGMIRICIVGRPNVGKSTLLNSVLGYDRTITGPTPGLTRDTIAVDWEYKNRSIRLLDTAGIRKRTKLLGGVGSTAASNTKVLSKLSRTGGSVAKKMTKTDAKLEDVAIQSSMRALEHSQVVIVVIDVMSQVGDLDASGPLSKHDLAIVGKVIKEGKALLVVGNKCDLAKAQFRDKIEPMIRSQLEETIPAAAECPILPISALNSEGVAPVLDSVIAIYDRWNSRIPTARLNAWIQKAQYIHPPPASRGAAYKDRKTQSGPLKIKYCTQASTRPPTFVLFVNRTKVDSHVIPPDYQRYLSNSLNKEFELNGVPLRFTCRGSLKKKNPRKRRKTPITIASDSPVEKPQKQDEIF